MKKECLAVIAAVRAQPWAIVPEYLDAIEALALRAMEADVLKLLAQDGHEARFADSRSAVAAVGDMLEGASLSTLRNGAAVVPILGAIYPRSNMATASAGGTSLDSIMRDFRVALASEAVDRIVLLVDSPGGVVSGLGEAAMAIRAATKPVSAFVTGMGASAAYWLASQAGEIVLDRAASVGSIGVLATLSRQVGPDQNGRQAYEVASSHAPNKRPDVTTEDGLKSVQTEVDAIEAVFIADVAAGRRVSADVVRADFGRGAMVSAERAVRAGMADRIGTLESLLGSQDSARMRTNPGGRRARAAAELHTRRTAADRS